MKIRPITRNAVAVMLAVLAALVLLAAPVAALFAVWEGDIRWLYTAGILLVGAVALYVIASQTFDPTPDEAVVVPAVKR